mmetsp:Transcript_37236/g.42766  ORF Transcript_37236/g.42766 Transcript_37236/m.42766 type:complete len:85 (+) Transcript_37236:2-256(+)|eukprot:CAMPEP_0168324694 /NCGR_PEP_ID=MMETSP0213-20121227/4241_1 /TAXON_ID=151035 /ORGANISM="Euplotes harpa, Strain FSP1.4" /LENGTH=84 /DNA_ID=CAMNT_0008327029 /DNA_START=11 /DNA_END=265 /DNA_ORIENTATION=+
MEPVEIIRRFTKLFAILNKESLDSTVIKIGYEMMESMTDDENIQLENDLADIKHWLFSTRKSGEEENQASDGTQRRIVRGYIDG